MDQNGCPPMTASDIPLGEDLIALMPVRDLLTLLHTAGIEPHTLPGRLAAMQLPANLLDDPEGYIDPTQVWRMFSAAESGITRRAAARHFDVAASTATQPRVNVNGPYGPPVCPLLDYETRYCSLSKS